jgi:hypothetical protein
VVPNDHFRAVEALCENTKDGLSTVVGDVDYRYFRDREVERKKETNKEGEENTNLFQSRSFLLQNFALGKMLCGDFNVSFDPHSLSVLVVPGGRPIVLFEIVMELHKDGFVFQRAVVVEVFSHTGVDQAAHERNKPGANDLVSRCVDFVAHTMVVFVTADVFVRIAKVGIENGQVDNLYKEEGRMGLMN